MSDAGYIGMSKADVDQYADRDSGTSELEEDDTA